MENGSTLVADSKMSNWTSVAEAAAWDFEQRVGQGSSSVHSATSMTSYHSSYY